jgi:hypothetical protein
MQVGGIFIFKIKASERFFYSANRKESDPFISLLDQGKGVVR